MSHVSKYLRCLSLFAAFILTVGCSSQTASPNADINEADLTRTSLEASQPATDELVEFEPKKQISDKEMEALNEMVDGLISMAKGKSVKANAKLQVLFEGADKSKRLAPMAEHAAKRIIEEASGTDSAAFAKSFLILKELSSPNSKVDISEQLAAFANDYPNSERPIQLYKQLSDRIVATGDSKKAIELLDHGIRHCAAKRSVAPLKKQKRMTIQMVSLMSRPNSTGKPPVRPKKSRTKKSSNHYSMIGKKLRPSGSTLQGSSVSSQQLKGEWVYVHFWATWCGACRSDMPGIVSDRKKLAKYGVKFVGVNLDEDKAAAVKYLQKNKVNWPQITGSAAESLSQRMGVKTIPTCVLVGPDGLVVEAGDSTHVTTGARYHLKKK